jgi:glycosyltransferase involved in cell wall biosynthesis
LAIGILAWNEQESIGRTLGSLFEQSLFAELRERGTRCEIFCVVNGSTDRTGAVAAECFEAQARKHPDSQAFSARVIELAERGKGNAWNQFVHALSSRRARVLFLMDADIVIHRPDTLWKMLRALEADPLAVVAVDQPCKNLQFLLRPTLWQRISLAASRLTNSAPAQLCGQLYAIRSRWARNIYLPRDLTACEDGFIKTLVCTDFLTRPSRSERLIQVSGAAHTFEAYTSPLAILRNQKRQMIGQTVLHVLLDRYLAERPLLERERLGHILRRKDENYPCWLKDLIDDHVHRIRVFWKLYPGLLARRFQMLRGLPPGRRWRCLPAALAGSILSFLAAFLAYCSLRKGQTHYWPHARAAAGISNFEFPVSEKPPRQPCP